MYALTQKYENRTVRLDTYLKGLRGAVSALDCYQKYFHARILMLLYVLGEYIKIQSPKPKEKYSSPYLEPLRLPTPMWAEVQKIKRHNKSVKAQRIREKQMAREKRRLEENEVNNVVIPYTGKIRDNQTRCVFNWYFSPNGFRVKVANHFQSICYLTTN